MWEALQALCMENRRRMKTGGGGEEAREEGVAGPER